MIDNLIRSNGVNIFKARLGVELEQADGKWDLWSEVNTGDGGDPFPGSTNNNYFCNVPSAFTYSNIFDETLGNYPFNYVALKDITVSGNSISANYCLTPRQPGNAPAISKPVNNANINGQPEFKWNVVPQAEKYLIQICTGNSFSSGINEFTISTSTRDLIYSNGIYTYQLPLNSLARGSYYYYRIAGINPLSNAANYTWSGIGKIGIMDLPPSVMFRFDGPDGNRLMGATTEMEYSLDGGVHYLPVTQNNQLLTQAEIPQITADKDIKIRYKGTELRPAGEILTFNINPSPAAPAVTADNTNNIVIGINNTIEYSTDGGTSWTLYNPSNPRDLTGDVILQVRVAAIGLTPVSTATVLHFTGANITAATDGSVEEGMEDGEVVTITVSNATFIGTIDPSKITLTGLPAGIGIGEVQRLSDTMLTVTLSGVSTADYDTDRTVTVSVGGDQIIPAQTPAANADFHMLATVEPAPDLPDPFIIFSFDGENAGKLINVTMAAIEFEYSLDGGSNYAEATTSCQLQSIALAKDIFDKLGGTGKSLIIDGKYADISFPPSAINISLLDNAGDNAWVKFAMDTISETDTEKVLADAAENDGKGLFAIGGRVFEFTCEIVAENKTQAVTSFDTEVIVTISLSNQDLAGIDADKLGVYRYNEALKKWEYYGGHYDAKTNTITFTTTHFSLYSVMEFKKTFTDIAAHWAKSEIEKMAAKHIARGYGNDLFKPDDTVTRAEFYIFMVRALELKEKGIVKMPAQDVKSGLWYYNELGIAFEVGIATVGDGVMFRPDVNITREEMAIAIARTLQIKLNIAVPTDQLTEKVLSKFNDHDKISNAAKESVAMAVQKNIIKGKPGAVFDPGTTATRAEAMTMIKRLLDLFQS